jgi:hypothetical protein
LSKIISKAFLHEPLRPFQAGLLPLLIRRDGVLKGQRRVLGYGWRLGDTDIVGMGRQAVLGVKDAHHAGDGKTPVTTLSSIQVVAELQHELVADLCILRYAEAGFAGRRGEAVVGKGWGDEVEAGRSVCAGFGQERKNFGCFKEVAGP